MTGMDTRRTRNVSENANDIIFTIDADSRFTSLNGAAELLLGYRRGELLDKTVLSIIAQESLADAKRVLQAHRDGDCTTAVERYLVLAKNGKRLLLEVSTRSVSEQLQFVGVQGIARDITERERVRQQTAGALKAEALGRLAAGVAHDFNNCLAIIMGCANLQMEMPETSDKQLQISAQIKKAVERASDLTSQLADFSRRRTSKARPIALNQVVQEMKGLLERLAGRQVKLSLQLESELPSICADRTQIEQILMNLVANAKDAIAGEGSVTIETEKVYLDEQYANRHNVVRPGWYTKLSVADTGSGMDQETQKHIFEPFFTPKEDTGTGLGLAAVYGIVKEAGGYIWVYSEAGRGTAFKICFPILPEPCTLQTL
jgi:two-component system, cell cycle sensor histidine kinase and response regulator CckA